MDMNERVERLEEIAQKTTDELYALSLDVGIIKATCATKADLAEMKAELASMKENGATKKELADLRAELMTALAEVKASIIMWVVSAIFLAQLLPGLLSKLGIFGPP